MTDAGHASRKHKSNSASKYVHLFFKFTSLQLRPGAYPIKILQRKFYAMLILSTLIGW